MKGSSQEPCVHVNVPAILLQRTFIFLQVRVLETFLHSAKEEPFLENILEHLEQKFGILSIHFLQVRFLCAKNV